MTTPPTPPTPPTQGPEPDDEALLAELGRVLAEADPPPDYLASLGSAVLGLRRVEEELAELVSDSLHSDALTRGPAAGTDGERLLVFAAGDRAVDLQVARYDDGSATVLGEVDPPVSGEVVVERPDGSLVRVDLGEGRFTVRLDAPGPVRLRLFAEGRPPVVLPWFSA